MASHRLHGRLDQRREHRLQVARRATDHLEHVGGGRLLLQRFWQGRGLRPALIEQADIADGDHGLVGEGLQQGDLGFSVNGFASVTAKRDRSDRPRSPCAAARSRWCDDLDARDISCAIGNSSPSARPYREPAPAVGRSTERPVTDLAANRPSYPRFIGMGPCRWSPETQFVAILFPSITARHHWASQSSQALSTMALKTGPTSVGEEAITLRMLLLPVW